MANKGSICFVYHRYVDALQCGSGLRALGVSQVALAAGLDVRDLYINVFQPAMHEIGRLWETKQITVAQEHVATSITKRVMAQIHVLTMMRLTPLRMFMNALKRTVVTACVGDEMHELGIQMVADMFEMEGWHVYHLGAHVPALDLTEMVHTHRVHVLALSVTLNTHMPHVCEVIQMVRRSPAGANINIMVGGQPFNRKPELYKKVGADFTAVNAREAVRQASVCMTGIR